MNINNFSHVTIFITASTDTEAHTIAQVLLKERAVACVNIIPEISSLFWWNEKLESTQECMLIAKTKSKKFKEVIKLVNANHSYQVPEIIALPILSGNIDYLKWIDSEVGQ